MRQRGRNGRSDTQDIRSRQQPFGTCPQHTQRTNSAQRSPQWCQARTARALLRQQCRPSQRGMSYSCSAPYRLCCCGSCPQHTRLPSWRPQGKSGQQDTRCTLSAQSRTGMCLQRTTYSCSGLCLPRWIQGCRRLLPSHAPSSRIQRGKYCKLSARLTRCTSPQHRQYTRPGQRSRLSCPPHTQLRQCCPLHKPIQPGMWCSRFVLLRQSQLGSSQHRTVKLRSRPERNASRQDK